MNLFTISNILFYFFVLISKEATNRRWKIEEEEDGSCLDVREGSVSPGRGGRCSDILVRQIRDPGAIGTLPYGCTRELPFGLHLQGPHPVRCITNTFLKMVSEIMDEHLSSVQIDAESGHLQIFLGC